MDRVRSSLIRDRDLVDNDRSSWPRALELFSVVDRRFVMAWVLSLAVDIIPTDLSSWDFATRHRAIDPVPSLSPSLHLDQDLAVAGRRVVLRQRFPEFYPPVQGRWAVETRCIKKRAIRIHTHIIISI